MSGGVGADLGDDGELGLSEPHLQRPGEEQPRGLRHPDTAEADAKTIPPQLQAHSEGRRRRRQAVCR